MALATLTIDINAKLANIERDMGKVAHLSEQSAYRIEKAWKAVGVAFAALGGGAIAGSLAAFTKNAIDAQAALDDMAEKTGATVESLSAMADVAKIGGHDFSMVEGALVRLNKALAGGDDEAKAAGHALAALGLKAEELRRMEPGQAMLTLAQALDKFQDSGGKSALIMALLGKNGAAALPFLKDLAEKGELQAKVTAEQAAEAERLQKSWNKLKVMSDDLGRSLASVVVPALNDVIKNFNAAQNAGFGFSQSLTGLGVRGIGESVEDAIANSARRVQEFTKERDALRARLAEGIDQGGAEGEVIARRLSDLDRLIAYYKALRGGIDQAAVRAIDNGLIGKKPLNFTPPDGDEKKPKTKTLSSVEDYAARINQSVASAISGSDIVKAQEYSAQIEALDKLFFDAGLNADVYASAMERLTGSKDSAVETTKRLADQEKQYQSLIAMTTNGKLSALAEQQDLAAQLLRDGRITFDGYDEIMNKLGGVTDKVNEQKDLAKELGLTFTSAFEDAIVGGKKFSEVLNGIGQDILRLVMRKTITEPLATSIAKFNWSRLLPSANGNVFSGPGIAAFSGQIVDRPTVFPFASGIGLMGEAGPEAILPLKRGSNGKLGVEGGGNAVQVNVFNNASGAKATATARNDGGLHIIDVMVDTIESAVAGNVAAGRGPLAAALSSTYALNRAAGAY